MKNRRFFRFLAVFLSAVCGCAFASAQAVLIIPHFAADDLEETAVPLTSIDAIYSEVFVVNPSDQEVTVTVEAFDDEGRPLAVGTFESRMVPPGGLTRFGIGNQNPVSGWLRISTDPAAVVRGSIRLVRYFLFGPPGDPDRLTDSDADPASPFTQASAPVSFGLPGSGTGVALVFADPDASAANEVSVVLRNTRGEVLGTAEMRIPPNGRRIFLIDDVFPDIHPAPDTGVLEITAARPVWGTTINYQTRPAVWRTVDFGVAR